MRRVGVFILLFATVAAAQEPDLQAIAAVMRAREAASYPYWMRFRVAREGKFWPHAQDGWILDAGESLLRRSNAWRLKKPMSRATHEAAHERIEVIDLAILGESTVQLSRRKGESNSSWRGRSIRRKHMFNHWAMPSKFGLVYWDLPVSQWFVDGTPSFIGREAVNGRPCLKVLIDLLTINGEVAGPPPIFPLVLWLSEEHGYYPLRVATYSRRREGGAPTDFTRDGITYKITRDVTTDELVRFGDAWLPVRGRYRVVGRSNPGEISFEAEVDSIRVGDIPQSLYALADVERAEVRESPQGDTYLLEYRPSEAQRDGFNHGLVRLPDDERIPNWMFAVMIAAGLAIGGLIAAGRR